MRHRHRLLRHRHRLLRHRLLPSPPLQSSRLPPSIPPARMSSRLPQPIPPARMRPLSMPL
jgi:hypothetical protein